MIMSVKKSAFTRRSFWQVSWWSYQEPASLCDSGHRNDKSVSVTIWKKVFPQTLDKPCMDFVACSSSSETMFAFKRRIVTVSGHFFIFKTKLSAFKRHSYNL